MTEKAANDIMEENQSGGVEGGNMNILNWIMFVVVLILSLIWLSGHGSGLIAGYNTMPEKEKENYNVKRLCRTVGGGVAILDLLVIILVEFEKRLPDYVSTIVAVAVLADIVGMLILSNTFCKK